MIDADKIVKYKDVFFEKYELDLIEKIIKNTKNSWQLDRSIEEIKKDTMIGKIAETILKNHIQLNSNFMVLNYDDFRNDDFLKPAPFDCIFFKKNNPYLYQALNLINNDIQTNSYGKLKKSTKQFLTQHFFRTIEIKSTRINLRHCSNGFLNFEKILEDDFLTYPFIRTLNPEFEIKTWQDYFAFLNQNSSLNFENIQDLKNFELQNFYDFYTRVYVQELNFNKYDVFLIGYISKQNFINNSIIKRMKKFNKSENALYISTNLKNGTPFKNNVF